MTPEQAKRKYSDMLNEIVDTAGKAGLMCMPNEIGFDIPEAEIQDDETINVYKVFTAFWLINIMKRQGVATKEDIDERARLCMSIIGLGGNEKTDKIALTLFE